jgi:transposase
MDVACGADGMRAEILVGRERRRRWSADDKLQIVREAFAPGARVALVARRRDVSRSQIYQWRAALREGRLSGSGGEVVGFVPVEMPLAPKPGPEGARGKSFPPLFVSSLSTVVSRLRRLRAS